jgi:hypothetical protein
LFSIVFFTIISCEKEIEGIGGNIIDNSKFSTGTYKSIAITNNKNVDSVPANKIEQYLLGSYYDNEFGSLKGSIVSQLLLPVSTSGGYVTGDDYNFGVNAGIDSVLIFIPYQSTKLDDAEDGKPLFQIDSIIGSEDVEFKLSVYELETYLNNLDPNDPTKSIVYYSDKVFAKKATPLYAQNFKINPNDTVAYIKRYLADGVTVYDTDTIKQTNTVPSIILPLDEAEIQQIFVDNASGSQFSSLDAFTRYFRGFYIEAIEDLTNKSHLISLDMKSSKMVIYYSNDQDEAETSDLNGNGIKGEQGARVQESFTFLFGDIKSNVLERDYPTPHESGSDRLYVQGAAGSIVTVDLFADGEIEEILKTGGWLINDASLTFYVDQNASSSIVPEQLFIYNYQENTQITDMLLVGGGLASVGGILERDDDGKPYKYTFKIADYISRVLTATDPLDLSTLAIKVYNPTDKPVSVIEIPEYSWNPKGVVLYNENGDSAGNFKAAFDIKYTILKTN